MKDIGFAMNAGKIELFYKSNGKNITSGVARKFIEQIGAAKNADKDLIERAKTDPATIRDVKRRIQRATLEVKNTGKIKFFTLETKWSTLNIPFDEAACLVIF